MPDESVRICLDNIYFNFEKVVQNVSEINLIDCDIDSISLINILQTNVSTLKIICFIDCDYKNDNGLEDILTTILHNDFIQLTDFRLKLKKNPTLKHNQGILLLALFSKYRYLTNVELDIRTFPIDINNLLIPIIGLNHNLDALDLTGVNFNNHVCSQMCIALGSMYTLKMFKFTIDITTDIDDVSQSICDLFTALQVNRSLDYLDFYGSKLSGAGTSLLTSIIENNETLKALCLSLCGLTMYDLAKIFTQLAKHAHLKQINVAGNALDASCLDLDTIEFTQQFAKTLQTNLTLKYINIEDCVLSKQNICNVANAFANTKNTTLRYLNIKGTTPTGKLTSAYKNAAAIFLRGLQSNTSLKVFKFRQSFIDLSAHKQDDPYSFFEEPIHKHLINPMEVIKSIYVNKYLHAVDFYLDADNLENLALFIQNTTTLRKLVITIPFFGKHLIANFLQALKKNTSLNSFKIKTLTSDKDTKQIVEDLTNVCRYNSDFFEKTKYIYRIAKKYHRLDNFPILDLKHLSLFSIKKPLDQCPEVQYLSFELMNKMKFF